MRVLFSFGDTLGKPGIGNIALQQVKGLRDLGVDVTPVVTSMHPGSPDVGARTTLTVAGRRIPHRALGHWRAYRVHDRRVARMIERSPRDFDLVHVWPAYTLAASAAARRHGLPVIREAPSSHTGHVFDVVDREASKVGIPPVPGHSHTRSEERIRQEQAEWDAADYVVVPAESALRTFVDNGVPEGKLLLHQYGYDPKRFDPDAALAPRDPERPFTALFVARSEPLKGLHLALDAWLASGVAERGRFLVCGRFTEGYREVVEDRLRHPSVEVLGFVDDPGKLMRESDVLVAPSLVEGSALVTYEAQACGCVLVASEATGARAVHGEHGLFHAPGDVEALTEHIRTLDADRGMLERMRLASIDNARHLTWLDAARALRDAYERALTAAREGAAA